MRQIAQYSVLPACTAAFFVCLSLTAQTRPTTQPTATTLPSIPAALPAEQMLDRMLQTKPGLSQPLLPVEQPAAKPLLRREGELIRRRAGRLFKDPATQSPLFAFEADGAAMQDPPVGVLASEELQKMEDALQRASRDLRFYITGTVTRYRDKNYVLIEGAEIAPDLARP